MLLLLEDKTATLPTSKKIYSIHSEDVVISANEAMFAARKSSIKHKDPFNASDDRQTEMMTSRW